MYEEAVRQQIEEVFALAEVQDEYGDEEARDALPKVSTLHDYGMMTSDEGLVLDYGEKGGVFAVHVVCYRPAEVPEEAV